MAHSEARHEYGVFALEKRYEGSSARLLRSRGGASVHGFAPKAVHRFGRRSSALLATQRSRANPIVKKCRERLAFRGGRTLGQRRMTSLARPLFSQDKVHPAVLDKLAGYQSELVNQVRGLVERHDVVIVGMTMNPYPGRARQLLEQQGIAYEYLGVGSYFSQWRRRLVLKMWTGWPTFPMIFVKGTFVGGFDDLRKLVESDELRRLLGQ
jgi:monothiol glutaredoxin